MDSMKKRKNKKNICIYPIHWIKLPLQSSFIFVSIKMGNTTCTLQSDGTYKDAIFQFNYLDAACTIKQCLLRSDGTYEWPSLANSRYSDSECSVFTCSLQTDGTYRNYGFPEIVLDSSCKAIVTTVATTTTTTTAVPNTSNSDGGFTTTTTVAPSGTIITTHAPTSSSSSVVPSTTMTPTTRPSTAPVVVPSGSGVNSVVPDSDDGSILGNAITGTDNTTVAPSFLGMTDNQRLALYVVLGLIVLVVLFMVMRRVFASNDNASKVVTAAAAVPVSSVAPPSVQVDSGTTA